MDETHVPRIARRTPSHWPTREVPSVFIFGTDGIKAMVGKNHQPLSTSQGSGIKLCLKSLYFSTPGIHGKNGCHFHLRMSLMKCYFFVKYLILLNLNA